MKMLTLLLYVFFASYCAVAGQAPVSVTGQAYGTSPGGNVVNLGQVDLSGTNVINTLPQNKGGTGATTTAGAPWLPNVGGTLTGALSLMNGSATTPSQNYGDPSTGPYRSALNEISFSTNGVQRHIWSANGNEVFKNPNSSAGNLTISYGPGETIFKLGGGSTLIDFYYGTGLFQGFGSAEYDADAAHSAMDFVFEDTSTDPTTFKPNGGEGSAGYGLPMLNLRNINNTAGAGVAITFQGSNNSGAHAVDGYIYGKHDTQSTGSSHGVGSIHIGTDDGTALAERVVINGTSLQTQGIWLDVKNSHYKAEQTTAPVATVNANAGTGATCALDAGSNDTSGSLTLTTTAVAPSAGIQCTITFNKAFNTLIPPCTVSATSANSIANAVIDQIFIGTNSTTLTFRFGVADAVGRTFTWNYSGCFETQ